MPRPRSLTTDDIANAALAIIDRDGAGALSIRAVASELGMGAMSLYRYFENREQLEGFVVDRVFAALDIDLPPDTPWSQRVSSLLTRLRETVGAHPAVVPMLLTHRFTSEQAMPWAESLLGALSDAGLVGEERSLAFRLLSSYAVGAIQTEHLGPLPRGDGAPVAAEQHPDDYPFLVENATYARRLDPATEFSRGVATLLLGLRATQELDAPP